MQHWRIIPDGDFGARRWDDDLVLHNAGSGDIHHLTPLAAELFARLQQSPGLDAASLGQQLAQSLSLEADAELLSAVEQTLADFERLGIVEIIPT